MNNLPPIDLSPILYATTATLAVVLIGMVVIAIIARLNPKP